MRLFIYASSGVKELVGQLDQGVDLYIATAIGVVTVGFLVLV